MTTRGMLLGKFMPPHRGHQFLVDFARSYVDELTVLVCTLEREPIDGALRYRWMRELCGTARVVHVTDNVPQEPSEHPDFWEIWRELIGRYVEGPIDYVFASEDYGRRLARELGASFVPVDIAREQVPVSATKIRQDPMKYWDFIPEPVRPHFVKRVCLIGPESTGKSTMARRLAEHFKTVAAVEYARALLEPKGGRCDADDLVAIARGQRATEEALARQANRLLFCDTDGLTTAIWSEFLFGRTSPEVARLACPERYDLYLLCDTDVPWVDDGQRHFREQRAEFFRRCREALDGCGRPYVVLRGGFEERFVRAVAAITAASPKAPTGSSRG